MGGSSGGGSSTSNVRQSGTTEVINSNIPKEFYPYLQKQMQMADALLQQDYVPYGGERLAGYTPEQQQAFQGINALGNRSLDGVSGAQTYFQNVNAVDPATGKVVPDYQTVSSGYGGDQTFASGYTGNTISGTYNPARADFAGGYAPTRSDFGSGYQGREMTSGYNPQDIRAGFTGAQITSDYDPQQFSADRITDRISEYQNPYTEQVLDRARERSLKSFQEQAAARNLQATQQGGSSSFGSRGILADAQAEGDFLTRQQDLEAVQLEKAFDKASGLAGQDIDRDIRLQGMTDQARRAASQFRTGAQEATARFGQAAGAQSLQAQIATDAARRARGSQTLQQQQLSDASRRAAGSQTLQAQQLRDAAFRAAGSQTLQEQQMADAAARAAGAQGLQADIASDAAARAGGAQTLQAQIAADAAARAAGMQGLQADLSNQRAYAMALARGDKAALSAMEADRLEQSMDLQRLGALSSMGADLRADQQRILDTQYQDFLGQRDFPKEQLQYYANLLRGLQPQAYAGQTTQTSAPGANQTGQLLNFLGGAASLGRA